MGGIIGRLFHEFARDHRGGHPDLGFCVPDADPHALQPISEVPYQVRAHSAIYDASERVFKKMLDISMKSGLKVESFIIAA